MPNTAKARRLHLASQKGSARVIAPLMPGGHPLVSRSNRRVIRSVSTSFKTLAAIVLILDIGDCSCEANKSHLRDKLKAKKES